MQNMLEQGLTFGVGSIQLSFRTIVFTQYMQDVFNPNVNQSNCAEGLHFSAFHYYHQSFPLNTCEYRTPRNIAGQKRWRFYSKSSFKKYWRNLNWRRIHEPRLHVTSTIARKTSAFFISVIPISIAKFN